LRSRSVRKPEPDATWETRAPARIELFDHIERFYNGQEGIRLSGISVPGGSSSGFNRKR
jgi:hypothetical protein